MYRKMVWRTCKNRACKPKSRAAGAQKCVHGHEIDLNIIIEGEDIYDVNILLVPQMQYMSKS